MPRLHYAPKGVAYCGNRESIMGTKDLEAFKVAINKCRKCQQRLDLVFGRFWGGGKQETPMHPEKQA